jgi:peptide/nickel transport system permease protein
LYLKGILQFDLGYSYRNKLPVLDLIMDRLPATLLLMGCAFVFSIVVGVLLGVMASRSRYTSRHQWLDSAIMSAALLLYATPLFWLSLLMIIFFSVTLDWLPAFGMESIGAHLTGWAHVWDVALHLVLPVISLGCFFMAVYALLPRA